MHQASDQWLTQFTALASRPELGGLLEDLRPMTANFAKVVADSIGLYRQTDLTSRCFSNVVLPAGDAVLNDGASSSGARTFKEFWYAMVGFAGATQNEAPLPTAGQVLRTVNASRQVQLGVKLLF